MRGYGINPNVYNGGAVVFNSAPFMNYFAQQQQRKQAKEDALNKYYQDRMTSLSPTGMRAKDIPAWSKKVSEWQDLGIKNKDKLLNPLKDNYDTITRFNTLYNELKMIPELSKEAGKAEGIIGEANLGGKLNPTDDDILIMDDISKPLNDPSRRGRTISELSINRPPFDSTKFLTQIQTGRERAKVEDFNNAIFDPQKGIMSIPFSKQYHPDDIKQMADLAPMVMQNDRSAQDAFKRVLESPELPKYQEAYNKLYPGIVDSPAKVAQAFAIMGVANATGEGNDIQKWEDPVLAYKQKENLVRLHSSLAEGRALAKEARDGKEQEGVLNKMMGNLINTAKQNMHTLTTTDNKTGKVIRVEEGGDIPAAGDFGKAAMTQGDRYAPDALRYIKKDGKVYVRPIIYQRKTNSAGVTTVVMSGNKPVVDDGASQKLIPINLYRDNLGRETFSGKILYGELGTDYNNDNFDPSTGTVTPQASSGGTNNWKAKAIKR